MLCRVNSDCGWLEADLWCYERGLAWRPAPAWFGGRAADIAGSCSCGAGLRWRGASLACQVRSLEVSDPPSRRVRSSTAARSVSA